MKQKQSKIVVKNNVVCVRFAQSFFAVLVLFVQIFLPIAPAFADELRTREGSENVPLGIHATLEEAQSVETERSDGGEMTENESTDFSGPEAVIDESLRESLTVGDVVDFDRATPDDAPSIESIDVQGAEDDEGTENVIGDTNVTATNIDAVLAPEPEITDSTTTPEEVPVIDTEIEETILPSEEDEASMESVEQSDEATGAMTTEIATTSQNVVMPELHTVNSEESGYMFGLDDCARVADGSFYCTPESASKMVTADRVFSAPDGDGDSEIYIEKDGILTQLTFNLFDDAAPYYDERSNTIVFHRLVDARYQIFSLDLEVSEETQLTQDSYNNMQPSRYDDLIVWQGWVGNDWEILMSNDGEISMLTDNTTHDIGPRINGEYIIWQAEESDGWKVRIYNTLTGETESIDDADGASIENPRLVLVYDAKHENGDIETRGYDLDTGDKVALAAQAPILPEEIPDPDQTGEERALIAPVMQLKPKTDDDDTGEPEPLPLDPSNDGVESSTDALVIPPFDSGTDTTEADSETTTVPSDILDIIIPGDTIEQEAPPIPDIVIPEFIQFDGISDPQEEVAGTH